jgi:Pentapeptide repeats (8 copies).
MTNHEFSIPNSDNISPVDIHVKADLSGTDLTTPMLREADLSNVDLEKADLRNAGLTDCSWIM